MWRTYRCLTSFGPLESTTQTANQSVQPFLHSSRQKVPILYNGRPCTPQLPLPMRDVDPDLTHGSFGPYKPKGHVDQFDRTCTADCRVSLYLWFARFLIKIAHSYGESGPHVIHGSLRAPESSNQTATRSLQPFSQGSQV